MYLLDTDTSIYFMNGVNPRAERRLEGLSRLELGMTTITLAELYYGAAHSKKRKDNEERIKIFSDSITLLPFGPEAARFFGNIKETLVAKGSLIGTMDLLIAAITLAHQATLVTHNTKDFIRIENLCYEDWFPEVP